METSALAGSGWEVLRAVMAYNSNAPYEPPRRQYYDQGSRQAPAQPAPRPHQQEQYVGGYAQDPVYERGYDPGYEQQQDGGHNGYTQQSRTPAYNQAYTEPQRLPDGGHQQQYDRSYDPRYQQRPQKGGQPSDFEQSNGQRSLQHERSFDPRYQQRPQNGGQPPDFEQPNGQRSQQPSHQAERQGYQMQPQNHHRPVDSGNGVQQDVSQGKRDMYEQQNARMVASPKVQGHGEVPAPALQSQAPPQKKRMTMEEWKAAERAKLHAAMAPDETLAQDNPFPIFPVMKPERPKNDGRGGGASSTGYRSSEEQARPTTSSSRHGDRPHHDQKPVMSPEMAHRREAQSQYVNTVPPTPSIDHRPYSNGPDQNIPPHQRQESSRPSYEPKPSISSVRPSAGPPVQEHYKQQRPMNNKQPSLGRPPMQDLQNQQNPSYQQGRRAEPQSPGAIQQSVHPRQQSQGWVDGQHSQPERRSPLGMQNQQQYGENDRRQHDNGQHRQQPPPDQYARPGTAPNPRPRERINTARPQNPALTDHQPLSPAYLPERAMSAQGVKGPSNAPNNTSAEQYHYDLAAQQASTLQVQGRTPLDVDDLYDDYHHGGGHVPAAIAVPPPFVQTRDAEIEAEMPDFDSAAPAQKAMPHKRNETVSRHLDDGVSSPAAPPPMPVMPIRQADPSVQSFPAQMSPQQDPQRLYQAASSQDPRSANGFDFGLMQTPQEQRYDQRRQPPGMQQQGSGYDQYGPPQPPYARQAPPRRSMDDARQMGSRQGPPQPQRSYLNGAPSGPPGEFADGALHGQYDAGLMQTVPRPEFGRNATAQSTWSDPGIQRVLTAPPLQSGLARPPRSANGVAPDHQQQQQVPYNPDALPPHPAPVRPGLMETGALQPAKPPPIRNYNNGSISSNATSVPAQPRPASVERPDQPITKAELERLRTATIAYPENNKQALLYAKKLVEAATVLASDGGRADPKTTNKNRERYLTEAYKRVKKLASAGYPNAQFYLADCYSSGMLGLEVDPKEAFNLYQAAAKQGHAQGAFRTAVCCEMGPEEGGGTRRDLAKAVQWYRRAAALGDIAAMYKLGMILLKGLLGQQRSVGEAVSWLKRSAERADGENPHALHELGTLYEPANTNPEVRNKIIADEKYARELFQQAAGLGYKFSQFRLGQAYEYGHLGLPLDHRSSIQWYSKAAAQGEHQAELALSGWYLTGSEGVLKQSDTEAYLWARKAASGEPPLAKAMFALGYFSEQGIGCPASLEDARRWYGRAACEFLPPPTG